MILISRIFNQYTFTNWRLENGEEEYNGESGDGSEVSEDVREEDVEQGND